MEKLDTILPAKAGELELVKISSPHRAAVYFQDGVSMVLDISGKGDFVPSVFALWSISDWLPRIWLKHFAVSKYILGGADVMLPGVNVPDEGFPEPFNEGDCVSICVPGNPAPIAVGHAAMSSRDAANRARSSQLVGGKGKLVDILHHFGDLLWESHADQPIPNPGFSKEMVLPLALDDVDSPPELEEDFSPVEKECNTLAEEEAQTEEQDQALIGERSAAGSAAPSGEQIVEGGIQMDGLLEIALLQALHKSVKDDMLPLPAGKLLQIHMLPNRFPGSALDLKKSSFKKMSKFLQAYGVKGARAENLVSLKEDKFLNEMVVTRIDRSHIMYTGFRPYKPSDVSEGSTTAETSATSSTGFAVEELYRASKDLYPVLDALGVDHGRQFDAKDAGELGFQYVAHAGLDQGVPDKLHIVLDPLLCDALFKGLIKKSERYPTHIKKSEIRDHVLKRMQRQFRVSRDGQELIKRGNLPPIQISEERRQGNKKVTKIIGVEVFLLTVPELASACQKKFACSTTTSELPGQKSSGHELVMQGQRGDEVGRYLVSEYQIPKQFIEVKKLKKK